MVYFLGKVVKILLMMLGIIVIAIAVVGIALLANDIFGLIGAVAVAMIAVAVIIALLTD